MSGITQEGLKRAQDAWNETDISISTQSNRISSNLRQAIKYLKEMGLDLEQDETYELLEDGLTKAAFDNIVTFAAVDDALQQYYRTVTITNTDYIDAYNGRRAYGLQHLMEYTLPQAEEHIKKTGLPAELSALARRELDMLLSVWRDGTLTDDMKRSAALAAHDSFRNARTYQEQVRKQEPDDQNIQPTKQGLSSTDNALKMIEWAEGYYKAEDIPAKYGSFGGWDKEAGTVPFSREAVEDLRKHFLTRELAMEFSLAKDFQDKGHFVLDASGSGHGMMVMPMQDILGKLEEYGYDFHEPETFEAIGTDIETFRECYQLERQNVQQDDKYSLIKPEFKL